MGPYGILLLPTVVPEADFALCALHLCHVNHYWYSLSNHSVRWMQRVRWGLDLGTNGD